ncbi:MAG: prepilin-type N-terminal cleavage/methylation domain-containing protein [Proteobacteria bacterium]|nr:prepilin-type N-terminal cleavage/methylation domain-containing protein [Pseudomonadota bacterium]
MKSFNKTGMTLVELMVVVAIVALLMGIMAYFVLGRRQNNAQVDLANDILALMQAQRTRAMSMNVATYVKFRYESGSVAFIQPRIGVNSICTIAGQLPILYTDNYNESNFVSIDVQGSGYHRTLDSTDTNKYISSDDVQLTQVVVGSVNQNIFREDSYNRSFDICFQPNGQIQFLQNDQIDVEGVDEDNKPVVTQDPKDFLLTNVMQTRITIDTADQKSGGTYFIDITGLGMIQSGSIPRS